MKLHYENIVQEMLKVIPQLQQTYSNELDELWKEEGEIPPHVAFGNILNPFLINLLVDGKSEKDTQFILNVFGFIEEMASCDDIEVRNVVSTTIMARIGDDFTILKQALKYMGKETKRLALEIERFYGRKDNVELIKQNMDSA
ncbi:hypothetical protein QFZ81_003937 [Paenibacillus sp. V4I9]|uniref:DUF7674 family protein n=1 Tax=Paenibacillus sp. V4I9 TaxID=3042308 RepID=UPI0027811A86|nr:hypothetical protein [Paenibacillus sp. V4I9]MDQ0888849.1 hypothetical protein [Paenibacillus sp. V4I9]